MSAGARWSAGHPGLDRLLGGGLPVGAITEWGVPFGYGGREVVLRSLVVPKSMMSDSGTAPWMLWVHGWPGMSIYPPAWAARGVDLTRLRVAHSQAPVHDLRPVFLEPVFRLIVLDAPTRLSSEDEAFLARQARALEQVVVVLRDGRLGREGRAGSLWARLRLNAWYEAEGRVYRVEALRGAAPGVLTIPAMELRS